MGQDSGTSVEDLEDRDAERGSTSEVRQHYSPLRLFRANLHDLRILLRESYVGLIALAVLLVADTLYLAHSSAFTSQGALTPWTALYESLKLLIFQSSLS